MEFTRREIVARIHIGEATLAKRVSEFATTAAGDLTLDEFDVRGREIENEQMALLENTQPSQEESVSGCRCIHIGETPHTRLCADCHDHGIHCLIC
jgi:transcription factor IIIB subunit 2